jgi:hypothetical protein
MVCAALGIFLPCSALANPVIIDGQSLIAFGIVAFWALAVESGITTLALVDLNAPLLRIFTTFLVTNLTVFTFAFTPLSREVPLLLLEIGVVLLDAAILKGLNALPALGGETPLSWRRALVASTLGNAVSYFVGVLANMRPWETK